MLRKNMTERAFTTWPSAKRQPFIVMVTVRSPWENVGRLASESEGTKAVDAPSPNQYSGRYINIWNWLMLFTEEYAQPRYGKMKLGLAPGASANTMVPEPPEGTVARAGLASATLLNTTAASARRRECPTFIEVSAQAIGMAIVTTPATNG